MFIDDILLNHIAPFEINDDKLKELFSFYLHLAPTIDSKCAKAPPTCGLDVAWNQFLTSISVDNKDFHIYAPGNIKAEQLNIYKLSGTDNVDRKSKRFICCYKECERIELACFLRHIRNSIAHGNVYVLEKGRKYIIFDDYNTKNNLTARILLSQTDLAKLRKIVEV